MRRPVWILAGPLLGAVFAVCQFALLIGPVRSALQYDLGFSVAGMAVIVVVYLVAAAGGFAAGLVTGRRAPISVAIAGLALMIVGAVLAALSGGAILIGVAGLLAGSGGGAVLGTAASLTGQVEQPWQGRGRLALGLAAGAGLALGLIFGWILASVLTWRMAYLAAVPVTLVALVATAATGLATMTRRPS